MVLSTLLSGGNIKDIIIQVLLTMPVILLALVVHETAHGYVAWKCGDPTAYNLGRLTLNPVKHLDPIGFFCMMVFGYGWAKPVPINTRNFRDPKKGMALCAAAGPAANLLLGTFSAILCGFFRAWWFSLAVTDASQFLINCVSIATLFLELGALYNFLLMAFNLIPVPPFDGSRIAFVFLPPRIYFNMMRYERQIMFGVLIAIMLLSRIGLSPFSGIAEFLSGRVSYLSFDLFGGLFDIPHLEFSYYRLIF